LLRKLEAAVVASCISVVYAFYAAEIIPVSKEIIHGKAHFIDVIIWKNIPT
jgi:hypothetical protein